MMSSADQTALGALIGLAGAVGFAAVLLPVFGQREEAGGDLGAFETVIVLGTLAAAGACVINATSLLQANQHLHNGIPTKVYEPLVLAIVLVAFLGVLARSPGDTLPQVFDSLGAKYTQLSIVAIVAGILAALLPLSRGDWFFVWAVGLLVMSAAVAMAPGWLGPWLKKRITIILDRAEGASGIPREPSHESLSSPGRVRYQR